MRALPGELANLLSSESGFLIREDIVAWSNWYGEQEWYRSSFSAHPGIDADSLYFHANKLFNTFPEFRSLFDYRTKSVSSLRNSLPELRRATDLYIAAPTIGPRIRIQHGHGTYLFAREIGSDFFVNHLVTVGSHRGTPIIGNRVSIRTGAVVVGPITVGDDVIITANCVVNVDVPPNQIAYAPRPIFMPKSDKA